MLFFTKIFCFAGSCIVLLFNVQMMLCAFMSSLTVDTSGYNTNENTVYSLAHSGICVLSVAIHIYFIHEHILSK